MGIATQTVFSIPANIFNNPDAVFDFYDGFDGTSLDASKWLFANGMSSQAVEAGGQLTLTAQNSSYVRVKSHKSFGMDYIVESKARHPQQGTGNMVVEVGLTDSNFGDIVRIVDDFPTGVSTWNRQAKLSGQADVNWGAMAQAADQQWHIFRVYRESPNVAGFQIDENPVEEVSSNVPTFNLPAFLMSYTEGANNQFIVDWIRVRKFAYPGPITTVGSSSSIFSITVLSPSTATAGGDAFTLTVNGSGFLAKSVIRWNGLNRTTTFVSESRVNNYYHGLGHISGWHSSGYGPQSRWYSF